MTRCTYRKGKCSGGAPDKLSCKSGEAHGVLANSDVAWRCLPARSMHYLHTAPCHQSIVILSTRDNYYSSAVREVRLHNFGGVY